MSSTDVDDPARGRTSRLVWVGTIVVLVAGAFALFDDTGSDRISEGGAGSGEPGADLDPDLEIDEAVITQYRDTGQLKYQLYSPRIEHFQAALLTELAEPDLTLHSANEPPWRMTARRGTIENATFEGSSQEIVHLEEEVQMEQHYADGRQYRLRTPRMTIHPDREYAETNRDVMITTHAGRTVAVGLKGNLQRGRLHLFSNVEQRVHTILLPDQFK